MSKYVAREGIQYDPIVADLFMAEASRKTLRKTSQIDVELAALENQRLEVAELQWYKDFATRRTVFTDDRRLNFSIPWERLARPGWRINIPNSGAFFEVKAAYLADRFHLKDDRGVEYIILMDPPSGSWRAPIPHTVTFHAISHTEKEPTQMPYQDNESDVEPLSERDPEIVTVYSVNDMPQNFTEQGALDTVADLLAAGSTRVTIRRFVKDLATGRDLDLNHY